MKDKTHMKKRWPTWKCEVEKRLHAYLTSSTPPYEDYPECPESYDIWGEYYQNGRSPEEAVNDFKSGKMRPKPLVEYWYIMLNSAINILKNDKGHESFTTLMARDYLKPLEKHDILPKSEMQCIEDWWLTGSYNGVIRLLTRKRDSYPNPDPATIEEAAAAAAILLRCDAEDLAIWTEGLWPEPLVTDGLKALCGHKTQLDKNEAKNEAIEKQNNDRFKAFVYTHLKKLPEPIWKAFREYSDEEHYSKRCVINSSLSKNSASMDDFTFHEGELENIGNLGDSPVYFSQERGIYLWTPDTPEDPFLREIWLTYPILPKNWS